MGFIKDVINELKYSAMFDNYGIFQKKMESTNRTMISGYDVSSQKIKMGEDSEICEASKKIILAHERIHKEITEKSAITMAYYNLNQIYDVLLNCFLEQFSKELRSFMFKNGVIGRRLNGYIQQYLMRYMDNFMYHMSRNKKLVKYCEFCLEYRYRYQALLNHTRLVQEGTATWCTINGDYEGIVSEAELKDFHTYIDNQKAICTNPRHQGNVYYDGYQIAQKLAAKFGRDSLVELAVLALSSPQPFDCALFQYSRTEFDAALQNQFHCDNAWKKLQDIDIQPGFDLAKCRNELYSFMYGKKLEPFKQDFPEFWKEKSIIDAINELEGKVLIHCNIKDYVKSEDYVPRKPMPYTQTRNIVINSNSEKEARDAIIQYHHKHKHSWGMPWQENPDGEFMDEYDENQRIHHKNITDIMKSIIGFSGKE